MYIHIYTLHIASYSPEWKGPASLVSIREFNPPSFYVLHRATVMRPVVLPRTFVNTASTLSRIQMLSLLAFSTPVSLSIGISQFLFAVLFTFSRLSACACRQVFSFPLFSFHSLKKMVFDLGMANEKLWKNREENNMPTSLRGLPFPSEFFYIPSLWLDGITRLLEMIFFFTKIIPFCWRS